MDNGFTGTNFDRPEFERMMQDVRTGKIQCIVVKDLSRFGRDYIETGNYLETIFPMLHIRFIAINDDFDNIRQSDVDSLAVPIKNMVNSLYAKDISKKIGLSYQMRREKGIPTSWCVPYGYRMNEQKSQYEVADEAKYVKLMNNKIAIYLRLSLSDGDLKKGSKDESNSIENQRLLLHSYIEKQDDLSGEIVEYVDDGYTGTNFAGVR